MKIDTATFRTSALDLEACPPSWQPEFAFVGRSNVGKSSLINMLTGKKELAKTSSVPGKTQLINFFDITVPGASSTSPVTAMRGYRKPNRVTLI